MKNFLIVVLLACSLGAAAPAFAADPSPAIPIKATVAGKYSELLKVIHCPTDEAEYGTFNDFGKLEAAKWCGDDAPSGHWVYVSPNWYIWKNLKKKKKKKTPVPPEASAGGKYSTLLKVINCPADEAGYGKFNDYGQFEAGEWCGDKAPAGHWVYVSPNWYIWKNQSGIPQEATMGGKYSKLLKVIHCPTDEAGYGKINDYGPFEAGEWCGDKAPAGHWVYVSPSWYIWAQKK